MSEDRSQPPPGYNVWDFYEGGGVEGSPDHEVWLWGALGKDCEEGNPVSREETIDEAWAHRDAIYDKGRRAGLDELLGVLADTGRDCNRNAVLAHQLAKELEAAPHAALVLGESVGRAKTIAEIVAWLEHRFAQLHVAPLMATHDAPDFIGPGDTEALVDELRAGLVGCGKCLWTGRLRVSGVPEAEWCVCDDCSGRELR